MKVGGAQIDRLAAAPPAELRAALVFGPDAGRVREVADRLARSVVDDLSDPFRAAELPAEALKDDPARLADELATVSLLGGRKLVRLRGAADAALPAIDNALQVARDGFLLVIDAGDLDRRSKLRAFFEADAARDRAAFACYADNDRDLGGLVKEMLGARRIVIDGDALGYVVDRLGADRMASRAEIAKLALYAGDGATIELAMARAAIGTAGEAGLDDIADAVGLGDQERLDRALADTAGQGLEGIPVLRAVQRHFQRLHGVAVAVRGGRDPAGAVAALRPPVFYQRKAGFERQAARWNLERVELALRRLGEAELACKTTGMPGGAITGQCLIALTWLAGGRAGRG